MEFIKVVIKRCNNYLEQIISADTLYVIQQHEALRTDRYMDLVEVVRSLDVGLTDGSQQRVSWAPYEYGLVVYDMDEKIIISCQSYTDIEKVYWQSLLDEHQCGFDSKPSELMPNEMPEELSRLRLFEDACNSIKVKGFYTYNDDQSLSFCECPIRLNGRNAQSISEYMESSNWPSNDIRSGLLYAYKLDIGFEVLHLDTTDSQLLEVIELTTGVAEEKLDAELFKAFRESECHRTNPISKVRKSDAYLFGALSLN